MSYRPGRALLALSIAARLGLFVQPALAHPLTPDGLSARALAPARPEEVFRDYLLLGTEHLLTGLDHILFVAGLVLLVSGLRARIAALSAFTIGHSITLCLSALSILELPQAPVEVGIAASLVVLALEVLAARPAQSDGPRTRRLALMACAFGLLHGLGFAGALSEAGLPPHAVAVSLLGFNLGVELGQLLVVLALVPLVPLGRRLRHEHVSALRKLAGYAIGSLAAVWCVERALAML